MSTENQKISERIRYAAEHWITHNHSHLLVDGTGRIEKPKADKVPEAPSWFKGGKLHEAMKHIQQQKAITRKAVEDAHARGGIGGGYSAADHENHLKTLDEAAKTVRKKIQAESGSSFGQPTPNATQKQTWQVPPEQMEKFKKYWCAQAIAKSADQANVGSPVRQEMELKRGIAFYAKRRPLPTQKSLFDDDEEAMEEKPKQVITETITTKTVHHAGRKEARTIKGKVSRHAGHGKKYALKPGERWITVHGSDHGGGSHVVVTEGGDIVLGGEKLAEQGITNLSDFHKPDTKSETQIVETHEDDIPGIEHSADIELANRLAQKLKSAEKIEAKDLFAHANEVHGGTRAEGKYGQSQAYDSLEAAVNKSLKDATDPTVDLEAARLQVDKMSSQVNQLPTQTNRDGNKDAFQQFSTPPHYAYACSWLANLKPGDKVLEPSAGTGSLAVHATNAGAEVYANELDEARAQFLRDELGDDHVFTENAEQIGGILPGRGVPKVDAVIMNPPFSQTAGRMGDRKELMTAANHIAEAGMMLKDDGRLVAIVGRGMSPEASRYKNWFDQMEKDGFDLRANVLVDGDVYKKYGTHFDSRVLVFDKKAPSGDEPIVGEVKSIPELMEKLEDVRNDRRRTDEPSSEQAVQPVHFEAWPAAESENPANPSVDASLSGNTEVERPTELAGGSEDAVIRHSESADAGTGGATDIRLGEPENGASGIAGPSGPAVEEQPGGTGKRSGKAKQGRGTKRSGKDSGGESVQQPESGGRKLRPAKPIDIMPIEDKPVDDTTEGRVASQDDLGDSLYDLYKPQRVIIPGAKPHPTALVESAAMAAVLPPVATYRPVLSPDVVENGMLSAAALETVVYAGQAHSQMLEANPGEEPMRRGYFIGDGTGCIAAGTKLFDPTTGESTAVEVLMERGETHYVLALTPTGFMESIADVPYVKGVERLFLVRTENNREVTVTGQHRFLGRNGWSRLEDMKAGDDIAVAVYDEDSASPERCLQSNPESAVISGWSKIVSVEYVRTDTYYDLSVPGPENYLAEGIVHHNSGKGRQIAGIIADNANQGRKKSVWLSKSFGLIKDARRDVEDVGQNPNDVFHFEKIQKGMEDTPSEGTAFLTYSTLRGHPKDPAAKTNLEKLVDWLGKDFDGVIVMDEAHMLSNSTDSTGARGVKKASQQALAGVDLQKQLPNARIVYSSATGATEISNLAYAERLGIWGRGTPFADKNSFINSMDAGGVAAMEAVAQSLKATGSYCSRAIAMDDGTPNGRVEYDRLTHKLSPDQHEMYDALADGWQNVLENIDKALEITNGTKSSAASAFWGAQQRFFNQVMTSMQTPAVIDAMEQDIDAGRSPVIQLVNTMEAATVRALAERGADEDDADIDISPRKILQQYLEASFPTERYETFVDANGNERKQMVTQNKRDENGFLVKNDKGEILQEPVHDPRAVALKESLLEAASTLRIPEPPIDQIMNHFGHSKVAEITGRHMRRVKMDDDEEPRFYQRNPSIANPADSEAFKNGEKNILIFSGAGDTGFSYHAGRNFKNQGRRVHYMLQPGWRADAAVQGFGRTNRTNQSSAPMYRLVEIDELKGQKRFISTIARRLDQLGAITKGQRQTGGGGLFKASDNLESKEASAALEQFFNNLKNGSVQGLDHGDVLRQLGMASKEEAARKSGKEMEMPGMGQFLNRMLSMRVDMQGKMFRAFEDHLNQTVEKAIQDGTLDTGVENYPATSIHRKSDEAVYKEPANGAEVRHVTAIAKQKAEKRSFDEIIGRDTKPIKFVRNKQSGQVWAAYKGHDSTDPKTGRVTEQYVLRGPSGKQYRSKEEVDRQYFKSGSFSLNTSKFDDLDQSEAERLWDQQHAAIPDFTESEQHFLTGALLPVWDRIPGSRPKIYRMRLEDGQTIVGRHVLPKDVPEMLRRMGVHQEAESHTAEGTHGKLEAGSHWATLANGWKLKPVMRQGERRIQLIGPSSLSEVRQVESDGVDKVKIGFDTQYFVPTGSDGAKVLERLTKSRPIVGVNPVSDGPIQSSVADLDRPSQNAAIAREALVKATGIPKPEKDQNRHINFVKAKANEGDAIRFRGKTYDNKDAIKRLGEKVGSYAKWDGLAKVWRIEAKYVKEALHEALAKGIESLSDRGVEAYEKSRMFYSKRIRDCLDRRMAVCGEMSRCHEIRLRGEGERCDTEVLIDDQGNIVWERTVKDAYSRIQEARRRLQMTPVTYSRKDAVGQMHLWSQEDERKHPRDKIGEFASKAESKGASGDVKAVVQPNQPPSQASSGPPAPVAGKAKTAATVPGESHKTAEAIQKLGPMNSPTTPPPPGNVYSPDPSKGEAARVGVPGMHSPPPPSMDHYKLPNLNPEERAWEKKFADYFEANPDKVADEMIEKAGRQELGNDGPNFFGTDDAKNLLPEWVGTSEVGPDGKKKLSDATRDFRSKFNTALHQTANAIAKKAFVKYLDTVVAKLPPEKQNVLVTAGGVASGKGWGISQVPEVKAVAENAGAVWDTAGEQNSTELPWVAEECRKRGFKMSAAYIHADPSITWENDKGGVISRATAKGRMVCARAYADSYGHGAKNFHAWAQSAKDDPNIQVAIIDNPRGAKAQLLPEMPAKALEIDPEKLYANCLDVLADYKTFDAAKQGGSACVRYWGPPSA